jgi:hypothetical protein
MLLDITHMSMDDAEKELDALLNEIALVGASSPYAFHVRYSSLVVIF